MHIDTALRKRDRCRVTLRDIYTSAAHFYPTSADLLAQRMKAQTALKGCPAWVTSYIDGVVYMLDDNLYREHLVFGGFYKETFYSVHSSRDDYYGKHGIKPSAFAVAAEFRGHYWKPRHGQDPKPFFVE
mgnify:CR=1 FL=1|tara:strand:+ start:306 stop:692 length:387 start_codon:yes stop_codon:yes gene_type:complete